MPRLQQIVIDSEHPASLARFWAALLEDFQLRAYDADEIERLSSLGLTPESDPCVLLDGDGLEICFQRISERAAGKRPMHLDLDTSDRRIDVGRALAHGATVVEEFAHHTWLRDPEGNDFCLVER